MKRITITPRRTRMLWQPVLLMAAFFILSNEFASCAADSLTPRELSGVVAQVGPSRPVPSQPIERATLYKIAGVIGATLVITFLCWYVAYPAILRNGNVWPVTLFGRVTAAAWFAIWMFALYLFWDKLTIDPKEFMKREALRILVGIVAIVFAFVWMRLWRTQKQGK